MKVIVREFKSYEEMEKVLGDYSLRDDFSLKSWENNSPAFRVESHTSKGNGETYTYIVKFNENNELLIDVDLELYGTRAYAHSMVNPTSGCEDDGTHFQSKPLLTNITLIEYEELIIETKKDLKGSIRKYNKIART